MKRNYLRIVILTLLFSWIGSGYAMAASGISEAEQSVLDKLRAGAVIDGVKQYLPAIYINQAENEFIGNEVDLTKEQAEAIITKIDEAIAIISDMDDVDMANVQNSEVALKLLTLVGEAAEVVDYKVSLDLSNKSIDIKNSDGDTVFIAKELVNQTGFRDYSGVGNGVMLFMFSVWGILLSRKSLGNRLRVEL
jgi:hypothetical protein